MLRCVLPRAELRFALIDFNRRAEIQLATLLRLRCCTATKFWRSCCVCQQPHAAGNPILRLQCAISLTSDLKTMKSLWSKLLNYKQDLRYFSIKINLKTIAQNGKIQFSILYTSLRLHILEVI